MMKRILGFLAALLVLSSCRPYVGGDAEPSNPSSGYDFSRTFEDFWNGMNRNYVYWDLEPTALWDDTLAALPAETREFILAHPASFWDLMYDYYKPKFDELGVFAATYSPGFGDAMSAAKGYFQAMTVGLVDGHFRVVFEDEHLFFPAQNRFFVNTLDNDPIGANAVFASSDLSQDVVNIEAVDMSDIFNSNNYFMTYDFVGEVLDKYISITEQVIVKPEDFSTKLAPTSPWKLVAGKISCSDGKIIPYLFTNYCYLQEAFDSSSPFYVNSNISGVIDAFFDSLAENNVKGVIVDVRGNTGGNPADSGFLFGRMIDSPHTFAYSRSKSGEGRLDYSPWMPVRIIPAPATEKRLKNTNVPIVLLADRGTFSGAEFLTMIVKSLPNGRVVGETTNGSASNTVDNLIYNGGAFTLGSVVTSVAGSVVQYKCADGNIYEGFGIPPDIPVKMTSSDWADFFFGDPKTDKRLIEAIKLIDSTF